MRRVPRLLFERLIQKHGRGKYTDWKQFRLGEDYFVREPNPNDKLYPWVIGYREKEKVSHLAIWRVRESGYHNQCSPDIEILAGEIPGGAGKSSVKTGKPPELEFDGPDTRSLLRIMQHLNELSIQIAEGTL